MTAPAEHWRPRLLPWKTEDGKRCYLSSDGGVLTLLANSIESGLISGADTVLQHARAMLKQPADLSEPELRFLTQRVPECLADVLTVAESRGERLAATESDAPGGRMKTQTEAVSPSPAPATGPLCNICFGHRAIWCPDCWGFDGCPTCDHTRRTPCPRCAGGQHWPLPW